MGPDCNHMDPFKKEELGALTCTDEKEKAMWTYRQEYDHKVRCWKRQRPNSVSELLRVWPPAKTMISGQ